MSVAALALGAVLAGCGGSSDRGGPAPGTTASSPTPSATVSAPGSATTPGTGSVPPTASTPAGSPPGASDSAPDAADVTVPVGTPSVLPTVAIGATASTTGARIAVTRTEAVTGEAVGPGQIAGPAVRLTVAVSAGSAPVGLDAVTVDLRDAAGTSAPPLSGPGAVPFTGTAAAGATVNGVYVFALATDARAGVSLSVRIGAEAPIAVFAGTLPG